MNHSTEKDRRSPTPRPWRVAFCITELDPGGAERQLVRLAAEIDRGRFEPEVLCLSGHGSLAESLRASGVPVTFLDARGRWDVTVVRRLRDHFRRTRPDLVQTFLFHANLAGRVAARRAGVPVVVSGIRVAEPRRWQLRLDRWTDRLVDRHACVSRSVAEYSARVGGLPPSKLVVIPNAVDVDRFATAAPAEFGFPANARVILFVGRLHPQKDPVRLIEAFRRLAAGRADAHLLIVGRGPLESELRRRAADLAGRVAFAADRDDVPNLMKAACCLALPSRWEGMPNVVLEAFAAGTPVVAAPADGLQELLAGGLGTLVHEPTIEAFAAALATAVTWPRADRSNELATQEHVRKHHTVRAMVLGYESLYRELLEHGGHLP